ncbi:MAG: 50S ribosomal protein L22 [Alphaproteobacteria bacterium]|nr:50S ribosomal protein L22 [Alphaproteobacteria bacterium]
MKQSQQARCFVKMLKTSPRKLNLVLGLVRGQKINVALNRLMMSKKRISDAVKKAVLSAVANAENNHGLDPEKLIVSETWSGKAMTLKRMRPGSRGQAKRILKPFSNLTVIVAEEKIEEKAEEKQKKAPAVKKDEKKSVGEGK